MENQPNYLGTEPVQAVSPSVSPVPMGSAIADPSMPRPELTPEILASLKARAKQDAIQQVLEQRMAAPAPVTQSQAPPKVVYVRRNLTVAELILIFALSCGSVLGIQAVWNFASTVLPSIEIKVK
jgi:hypothetical protein